MKPALDIRIWPRRRVRLVRQTEAAECGLACLAMVANYHGLDFDLSTIRRNFPTSLRGSSLKSLIDIADAIGLTTRALRVPLAGLANLRQPAILHWNMNHFVVLERIAGARALIHDPVGTSCWIGLERLSRHFTGVVLELQPGLDFQPSRERQRLQLSQLWQRISGIKRALLQTLLLSAMLEGFVLLSPYYLQLAVCLLYTSPSPRD